MQLDKLIVEPRVRTPWSAVDLGTVLARNFWFRGVALHLALSVPVFLICRFLTDQAAWLPYLVIWWLKPMFERPFLYSLSRELFSQTMGFWHTLRAYRDWLFPSIVAVLSTRRLSTNRGMYAPISLLESPNSAQYGRRASVLGVRYSGTATWLTVVLYHVESFFAFGLLALIAFLFPDQIEFSTEWLDTFNQGSLYLDACFLLIMATVAPFYCASGFMLYISRRIELEGWDIEICFRNWMQKRTAPQQTVNANSAGSSHAS